jgi:hypothetical protein
MLYFILGIPLAYREGNWVRGEVNGCFGAGESAANDGEGSSDDPKPGETEDGVHGL